MSNTNVQTALQAIAESSFTPRPTHIRAKEEFWAFVGGGDGEVPETQLNELATQFRALSDRFRKHWAVPGFSEWVLEKDWARLTAEATAHAALREIGYILTDAEQRSETKIAAAKVAREYYDRLVPKTPDKMADEEIGKMTPEELREFIRRNNTSPAKAK